MTASLIEKLTNEFNRTKGDHPQYASGLSAAIAIVREHEEEKPGTITTGDLKVSGGPSEISAVRINDLGKQLADVLRVPNGGLYCSGEPVQINEILEIIRTYLRTTEPVSVDLDNCANAILVRAKLMGIKLATSHGGSRENAWQFAKAVLDAAGVKYVS